MRNRLIYSSCVCGNYNITHPRVLNRTGKHVCYILIESMGIHMISSTNTNQWNAFDILSSVRFYCWIISIHRMWLDEHRMLSRRYSHFAPPGLTFSWLGYCSFSVMFPTLFFLWTSRFVIVLLIYFGLRILSMGILSEIL